VRQDGGGIGAAKGASLSTPRIESNRFQPRSPRVHAQDRLKIIRLEHGTGVWLEARFQLCDSGRGQGKTRRHGVAAKSGSNKFLHGA